MITFVYADQEISVRVRFAVSLDSAPSLSLFLDGSPVAHAPINGTGSGSAWVFSFTVPDTVVVSQRFQAEATGVGSGVTMYVSVVDAVVIEWVAPPGTPIVVPPVSPLGATGYCLCVDEVGVAEPDVTISMQMVSGPGTSGYSYSRPVMTAISDEDGMATFIGMIVGATYEVWRGVSRGAVIQTVVVPDEETFVLPETM